MATDIDKLFVDFDVVGYVNEYEYRGDTDYTPNNQEKELLVDAISGVIADLHDAVSAALSTSGGGNG